MNEVISTRFETFLVFTNVAETSDGGVYWEGMDGIPPDGTVTSWLGETWTASV